MFLLKIGSVGPAGQQINLVSPKKKPVFDETNLKNVEIIRWIEPNKFNFMVFSPLFNKMSYPASPSDAKIVPHFLVKSWSESNSFSNDTKIFVFEHGDNYISMVWNKEITMKPCSRDPLAIRKKMSSYYDTLDHRESQSVETANIRHHMSCLQGRLCTCRTINIPWLVVQIVLRSKTMFLQPLMEIFILLF